MASINRANPRFPKPPWLPRLTDEAATGKTQAFFGNPSPSQKLTRADLAGFMLAQLTETQWLRQAPIVSN